MQRKKGISLIVLVITIIVMIILAATIILAINNNNVVHKAKDAVNDTNLKQIQELAQMAWADAYIDGKKDVDELKDAVDQALENAQVDVSKYEITVTTSGVSVKIKETTTPPVEEPNKDDTTPTQLSKPTISLSGDTLTITDNAENGSYTASFEVYVGNEKKATLTNSTTLDLTTLNLEAGTHSITVKSVAAEDSTITASETSEAVEYIIEEVATTLGALVASAANYGDVVKYTVTVNAGTDKETTIDDWRVFYKQNVQDAITGTSEEYVYIITSGMLAANAIPTKLEDTEENGGAGATIFNDKIYWLPDSDLTAARTIQKPSLWLANWNNGIYNTYLNAKCVSYFLDETYWESLKNTATYGDYVVGAIGTPTAEMFVASWNEKRLTETNTDKKKLSLDVNGTTGYYINDVTTSGSKTTTATEQSISTTDDLYIWSTTSGTTVWLASPAGYGSIRLLAVNSSSIYNDRYDRSAHGLRPVVCLKSNIPAYVQGEGDEKTIILDVD